MNKDFGACADHVSSTIIFKEQLAMVRFRIKDCFASRQNKLPRWPNLMPMLRKGCCFECFSADVRLVSGGPIRLHHQAYIFLWVAWSGQDEHGSFVTYEFLRRKVFRQWAIDKGLLRGLLRHVWQPDHEGPLAVGDFGAGGGHYSAWLNDTGLVTAFAFDGTQQAGELTDGLVQEVNLVEAQNRRLEGQIVLDVSRNDRVGGLKRLQEMHLWRRFDWILCLEVGEHVPKAYAGTLLANLRRHATKGLVMSWSDDWEGIGHVNCLSRADFVALVEASTGFVLDEGATEAGRELEVDVKPMGCPKGSGQSSTIW